MKAIYLVLALLLFTIQSQAQERPLVTAATMPKFTSPADFPVPMATEPFKQANVVYILTKDSTALAFKTVGRLLLAAGYTFASTDKEFWNITTNTKGNTTTGLYTISATVDEQKGWRVIALRGQMAMVASEILIRNGTQAKRDITYAGMKGSVAMSGWLEMDRVAKSYIGGQVGYWSL